MINFMIIYKYFFATFLFFFISSHALSEDNYGGVNNNINQTKIDWLLDRSNLQKSRGGTTRGKPAILDPVPSKYFNKLQKSKNKKDQDRLAILSMTGEYKVSFEFNELYGSKPNYALDNPYKSWGTEVIIIVENKENFISLQHIMVMYMQNKEGKVLGPYIQKHWRQDWTYEDTEILNFQGNRVWQINKIAKELGSWSQTVFQVDDTPRYESYGTWVHSDGASRWVSKSTPRPLPRREFSVRNDYDILLGLNKILVMPWGWVMEEMNEKIKNKNIYLGSEYGVARYQKIKDYQFKPAYDYWKNTKTYWQEVRKIWRNVITKNNIFCLNEKIDSKPTYIHFFSQAETYSNHKEIQKSRQEIKDITEQFLDRDCNIKKL